jgi:GntR family transcriptional repressor for pyruvate dehydrogenase complex
MPATKKITKTAAPPPARARSRRVAGDGKVAPAAATKTAAPRVAAGLSVTSPVPASLSIAKVRPAYHQVAEQLRSLILRGDLGPGERLPTEPELSAMFGVSRSTVREALRVLSSQNLVITTRGALGGTAVALPEPEYIGEFLEASFGLMSGTDAVTVEQFLEIREQLEVPAASMAARRCTPAQLAAMHACLSDSAEDLDRADQFQGNATFHSLVLEATGNPLLSVIAKPIVGVLRGHFLREAAPKQFWRWVADDHQEIYDLIKAGADEEAGQAMQRHLTRLRPVYVQVHRQRGSRSRGGQPSR